MHLTLSCYDNLAEYICSLCKYLRDSAWTPWRLHGVHGDSRCSQWRLQTQSINSSWTLHGLFQEYMEFTRSPAGVYQEYTRSPAGGFMDYQDSIRTPGGVHQNLWGSVTYSLRARRHFFLFCIFSHTLGVSV